MTSSNSTDITDWFLDLPDSRKVIFLALVSGQLTVHGRAFGLDLSGEEQIKAFKGLNEIQHKISFHIAAICAEQERYPDDVFLRILSEQASFYGLSAHLLQSSEYARSH